MRPPTLPIRLIINDRGIISVYAAPGGIDAIDITITEGRWGTPRYKRVYRKSPWILELAAALNIEKL